MHLVRARERARLVLISALGRLVLISAFCWRVRCLSLSKEQLLKLVGDLPQSLDVVIE